VIFSQLNNDYSQLVWNSSLFWLDFFLVVDFEFGSWLDFFSCRFWKLVRVQVDFL